MAEETADDRKKRDRERDERRRVDEKRRHERDTRKLKRKLALDKVRHHEQMIAGPARGQVELARSLKYTQLAVNHAYIDPRHSFEAATSMRIAAMDMAHAARDLGDAEMETRMKAMEVRIQAVAHDPEMLGPLLHELQNMAQELMTRAMVADARELVA